MSEKKIRVLHAITHLAVGGAQDNTLLTVAGHDRSRFEVSLAASPAGPWLQRAQQSADHFYPIPDLANPLNPIRDIKAFLSLLRLMRREKFDIVHTHSSKAGVLGRWAAHFARVPMVVHTIHGFAFHDFMPAWKRNFYITIERLTKPVTDFFATVCELNRQQAKQLNILSLENSQTIYSGIDFKKFDRPCDIAQVKARLDIPDFVKTIAFVGRLESQKAPYYLIEAFATVLQQCPDTLLLLVGDGDLEPQLRAQVKDLKIESSVRFLGARADVPDILKMADIFALSSLWEGLGRAMTEAMIVAKPVVVPEIYGIPETVHHNETGLLFPAGDVPQLAAHLIYLLQHPEEAKRLGQNAQALTRTMFDADKMVADVESVYDKLMKRTAFTKG